MNSSLSTFMTMAITTIILLLLFFGITYEALQGKDQHNRDVLQEEYNLQIQ